MKVDRKPFLDLFKSKKPTLVFVGCSHLRGPDKDTEDAFKESFPYYLSQKFPDYNFIVYQSQYVQNKQP